MRKFLIDTDCGIDDSVAILYAHSAPDVDITAITTSYGTARLENTTRNVLGLCTLAGIKCRIGLGSAVPIVAEPMPVGGFHGESGIGCARLPQPTAQIDQAFAWDVIYEEAVKSKGKLTIVTLGPLSNLATALLKYEDLPKHVGRVVIMGGTTDAGNIGPCSEANILHDPHAAEVVFRSGLPIELAGLNATEETRLDNAEFNRIFSRRSRVTPTLMDMFDTYKHSQNQNGEPGFGLPDAAAMLVAIAPDTAQMQDCRLLCETSNASPLCGRTIADTRGQTGPMDAKLVSHIDKAAFVKAMEDMLAFFG